MNLPSFLVGQLEQAQQVGKEITESAHRRCRLIEYGGKYD